MSITIILDMHYGTKPWLARVTGTSKQYIEIKRMDGTWATT